MVHVCTPLNYLRDIVSNKLHARFILIVPFFPQFCSFFLSFIVQRLRLRKPGKEEKVKVRAAARVRRAVAVVRAK